MCKLFREKLGNKANLDEVRKLGYLFLGIF